MTKTSISLQELRKRIAEKAKADPCHRFWGLYTHVWKLNVLEEAYRLAKSNNGAPGIDGVSFAQVESEGKEHLLSQLSEELREKTYRPLPCRLASIPKEGGTCRGLKIPAIRDRIVQGALRLIIEPIFEADFQPGSYGYRPNRTAHQALERVEQGLYKRHHHVIDLDLASYFDTVRHHILLEKIAQRIQDADVLWLCKRILKSSGRQGIPQGSVIGPLWSNLYLNDVDKMLERAQEATKRGPYLNVQYTRFADDMVILISNRPNDHHWAKKVEKRLREELEKLDLRINEAKTKTVQFSQGEPFEFLGYTFRWVQSLKNPEKKRVLTRPQKKKRTRFLRGLKSKMRRNLHRPVEEVVRKVVNPAVRGWVNYFRWGNASKDLSFVRWKVRNLVQRCASRQRPKRKGGRTWTTWSHAEIYEEWGLFSTYRVLPWQQRPRCCVT